MEVSWARCLPPALTHFGFSLVNLSFCYRAPVKSSEVKLCLLHSIYPPPWRCVHFHKKRALLCCSHGAFRTQSGCITRCGSGPGCTDTAGCPGGHWAQATSSSSACSRRLPWTSSTSLMRSCWKPMALNCSERRRNSPA